MRESYTLGCDDFFSLMLVVYDTRGSSKSTCARTHTCRFEWVMIMERTRLAQRSSVVQTRRHELVVPWPQYTLPEGAR